jgi:transcriptional regulator with XRE-family HTH domain
MLVQSVFLQYPFYWNNFSCKMDDMDINAIIARRVRQLRDVQGYSLDELARRSGVSRSNISLIERGQSSPTATVLDKLAAGLGATLASLFEDGRPAPEPSPVARVAGQPVWTDPDSGYMRRNVSPAVRSLIQLVDVVFPAGQSVAYGSAAREDDVYQQVWMIEGVMEVTVGTVQWRLETGDCLAMRLDSAIAYHNPTNSPARYLVALAPTPFAARRSA